MNLRWRIEDRSKKCYRNLVLTNLLGFINLGKFYYLIYIHFNLGWAENIKNISPTTPKGIKNSSSTFEIIIVIGVANLYQTFCFFTGPIQVKPDLIERNFQEKRTVVLPSKCTQF